ncbi:MAG: exodeoxyribonuclease V subunit alpha [Lachnospiraceae bacterium]|nr:exodeoxyribonuclease V subunit alpha [Lachnospiraceae bacterium]
MKKQLKDKAKAFAEKVAVESHGKSFPGILFEPKIPDAVRRMQEDMSRK